MQVVPKFSKSEKTLREFCILCSIMVEWKMWKGKDGESRIQKKLNIDFSWKEGKIHGKNLWSHNPNHEGMGQIQEN